MVIKNKDEVSISIGIELAKLKKDLNEAKSMLKTSFSKWTFRDATKIEKNIDRLKSKLRDLNRTNLGLPKGFDKGFSNINAELLNLKTNTKGLVSGLGLPKGFDKNISTNKLNKLVEPFGAGFTDINTEIKNLGTNFQKLEPITKSMNKATKLAINDLETGIVRVNKQFKQPPFAGYALSLMFAGMAIKGIFDTIWKTSSATFKEVMNSVEDTTNGFSMMEGTLKYLQFTAGAALEPIAMWLIPIIDSVSEWISENEELFRTLVVIAGVLGTILMVGGMLKLAFDGFLGAFKAIGLAVQFIGPLLAGLTGPMILGLIAAGVLIAAVIIAWKKNFMGFKDYIISIFNSFKNIISGIITFLKDFFGGIWKVIKGIWTGDIDLIIEGITQSFKAFWKLMVTLFKEGVTILHNVFAMFSNIVMGVVSGIINFISSSFINVFKLAVGVIRRLIEAANLVPGVNISTSGLSKVEKDLESLKENITLTPEYNKMKTSEDIFGKEQKNTNIVNNFYNTDNSSIIKEIRRYT
jgi:hypothetical protein